MTRLSKHESLPRRNDSRSHPTPGRAIARMPAVTKQNLGVLLGISPAALDYRVRRMQATGELLILRSGLYALASPWRAAQASAAQARRHLDYLSGIVRSPSYASLEYVLEEAGMIPDSPFALTCITPKTSRTYETPSGGSRTAASEATHSPVMPHSHTTTSKSASLLPPRRCLTCSTCDPSSRLNRRSKPSVRICTRFSPHS